MGEIGGIGCGIGGAFTSTGVILVLFILLVIVSCAFI
ncbi:sporulation protein YjcZ [Paenibacillus segetis]|nr:sporulation protein YjcZ [Paenibacillus segetis]